MGGNIERVVALDVGTRKVAVLVAERDEEGRIRMLGVGTHPSQGLRKGEVVHVEGVTGSIERAVAEAERVSNGEIRDVFVGVGGSTIQGFNRRALVPIAKPAVGVTSRDMERVIAAAQAVAIAREREVVQVIPQEFAVDEHPGIINPEGMHGTRLEAQIHIVTATLTSVQNLMKSINQAGLTVEDYILQPLASSLAVLRSEEQKSGVILMDIGGGTTDYLLFQNEVLRDSGVLGVGGDHVTNDISIGLKLLQGQAEEIKKQNGCALAAAVPAGETVALPAVLGRAAAQIPRERLCRIIELRMTEIFTLVRRELEKKGLYRSIGSGAVLTGGASLLDGVVALAEKVLEIPVRVGRPWGVTGLLEIIDSPVYATAVGLVKFGFQYRDSLASGRVLGAGATAWRRMRAWMGKYF